MRSGAGGFRGVTLFIVLVAVLMLASAALAAAPQGGVQRVNVAYDGGLANNEGQGALAVSADGRYVAFASSASNIIEGDTNGRYDVFVRDTVSQETTLVNVAMGGGFASQGANNHVEMTPDGKYVVFTSEDTDLVPGDTNGRPDVFRRDMVSQETTRVSTMADGTQANYYVNGDEDISDDGRYIVFGTAASNLFPGDLNSRQDCVLKDMQSGVVTNVSYTSAGGLGNDHSFYPVISGDGSKVAFVSYATNMVPGDVRSLANLFIRDLGTGDIERVDATTLGGESSTEVDIASCDLDYTGRRVAFASRQTDIVDVPVGVNLQIYLRDTQSDETTVVARTIDSNVANAQCNYPNISSDGRWVSFVGGASNLVADDTNGVYDVFLRDMDSDTVERLNYNENGEQLNAGTYEQRLCADATSVAFNSWATNIVEPFSPGGRGHIYLREFRNLNTPPVAAGDAFETVRDTPLVVAAPGVLGNDTDAEDDTLTAIKVTDPAHGSVTLGLNGSFTYTPAADYRGTDTFTYQANDGTANSNVATVTVTVTLPPIIPIEGADRFETAVAASLEAYPDGLDDAGARTVVIATGRNWPDALGGSSLAGALDGPILLVDTAAVPADVTSEITRLKADKAIILGGTAAVTGAVEAALKTQLGAGDVTRIAGTNRYETADKTASKVIELRGAAFDGTAFVATGAKFPDALGAAPLAAANAWPLYLANPATGLSAATKAAMNGVDTVLVLGGTAVVLPAVETYLNTTYGDPNVTRLAGADRYDTAAKIATWGVNNAGLGWNRVAIATGTNFPDALAGGVLQGRVDSVMLLTKSDALDPFTAAALSAHKTDITSVTFFGGLGALPQTVRDQVSAALE